ncbi:hypothetical protein JAAARDRAFT_29089 [Jaapia argillacea MUCL 33604]|uniref:NAD(P)-binding protein n=1 Tax=Jaapia argillacea MUCL 33604 TaxID=933084 RepID=A0A067QHV1_9AGAM|nr:hypothetical protein JAAARDRAFT_29089 [Jaapia argillacea MUCL 33604]
MPSYVITGASRGIGLEFVRQLSASADNQVFGIVRNPATATKLTALGRQNVHVLQADIVDVEALKSAAAEVGRMTGGALDVLINNAALVGGDNQSLTLSTYPEGQESVLADDLRQNFEVNVIGVINTINAFLPLLRKGNLKQVITLSTGLADTKVILDASFPVHAPYSITKAALNMVVAKYAAEFKKEGLIFLAISPGVVNTAEKPPSPEQIEGYKWMVARFQEAAPTWDGQALSPEVSVKMMLDVVANLSEKNSGAFVSQYGNQKWL